MSIPFSFPSPASHSTAQNRRGGGPPLRLFLLLSGHAAADLEPLNLTQRLRLALPGMMMTGPMVVMGAGVWLWQRTAPPSGQQPGLLAGLAAAVAAAGLIGLMDFGLLLAVGGGGSRKSRAAVMLGRVLASVVVAYLASVPMVLALFSGDIDAQVREERNAAKSLVRADERTRTEQLLRQVDQSLGAQEKEREELTNRLKERDAEVTRMQSALAGFQKAFNDEVANPERRGKGPIAEAIQVSVDKASKDLMEAQKRRAEVEGLLNAAAQRHADAAKEASKNELVVANAKESADERRRVEAEDSSGLSYRYGKLKKLLAARPDLNTLSWYFHLALLAIDLLPLLAKLTLGRPKALDRLEQLAERRVNLECDAQEETDRLALAARPKSAANMAANRELAAEMTEKQRIILQTLAILALQPAAVEREMKALLKTMGFPNPADFPEGAKDLAKWLSFLSASHQQAFMDNLK